MRAAVLVEPGKVEIRETRSHCRNEVRSIGSTSAANPYRVIGAFGRSIGAYTGSAGRLYEGLDCVLSRTGWRRANTAARLGRGNR